MTDRRALVRSMLGMALLPALAACASLSGNDPLQVTVAGIESLPGEGLEVRMLVKLRVQNPNEAPIEYDGVAVHLDVLGKTFASGVSDGRGTVPRFGEAIVAVPVTVSILRVVRNVVGMLDGKPIDKVDYAMSGKLSSAGLFGSRRFTATGEFDLSRVTTPSEPATPDDSATPSNL